VFHGKRDALTNTAEAVDLSRKSKSAGRQDRDTAATRVTTVTPVKRFYNAATFQQQM
jgi:hypothetical protein